MIAERWEADVGESLVLHEGSALRERLYERIARHFGRVEVRDPKTASSRFSFNSDC